MRLRALSAALVPSVALGVIALGAPSASAAAQCTLSAPAKVAISKPYAKMTLKASGACAGPGGFASWSGNHSYYGPYYFVVFDGTATATEDLYDWDRLGKYTWAASWATDANYNDLTQNSPQTEIRFGSWSYLSTTRSGTRVTVKTQVNRYSPTWQKAINYSGARSTVQYRGVGAVNWHNLKTVTADSKGAVNFAWSTKSRFQYRVVTTDSSTTWGSTSSISTR